MFTYKVLKNKEIIKLDFIFSFNQKCGFLVILNLFIFQNTGFSQCEIANNNKIYNSLVLCTNGAQDPICNNHWQDLNCTGCGSLSCEETPDGNLNGSQAICPSTGNPPSYEWQFRNASNNWVWENAPGVYWEDDYNPGSTSESTWYRRRTLCEGCTNWTETGEVVDVHVQSPLTHAGTINGDYCGTFPYTITTGQIQGMDSENLTQFIEFQWRRNCDGGGWETLTNLNFLDVNDNSLISYVVSNNAMIGNTTCLYQKRMRVHGCSDWVTTPNITISNPDGCCTFPDVSTDSYSECPGDNITGNVSTNDGSLTNPSYSVQSGGSAASSGSISMNANGSFTYNPSGTPCGNFSFTYRVCNNNDSSCCSDATVSLNYSDNENPNLTNVPGNVTVNCNSVPTAASPTATDNCDSSVSIALMESIANGSCSDSYTITRRWTATDNCGNTDIETQIITVQDQTDPVLSNVPNNTTVQYNAIPAAASPTATDNCDTNVSITLDENISSGACFADYTITRTWTATDNCNRTDVESQVITVQYPAVSVNVTGDERCGQGVVNLSASGNTFCNELRWYNSSTGGNVIHTGTSYAPSITSTTSYYVSCYNTDQDCESTPRQEVIGVINAIPTIVANATCSADGSTYSITVTTTSANILMSNVGAVTGTAPNFTVSGILVGTSASLEASNNQSSCSMLEVISSPNCSCSAVSPTVTGDERCGPGIVNLSASGTAVCDELRWYNSLSGGSVIHTGTSYSPSISSTTSYYVSCYNMAQDCENVPRQEVVATINANPTFTLASNPGTCNGGSANNDAVINITSIVGDEANISVGTSYTGPVYGSVANIDVSGGSGGFTGLIHNSQYTVRVFNGDNDCFTDETITTSSITCVPGCTNPTYSSAALSGTCTGTSPNNDAAITLTSVVGDEANISAGTSYTGPVYGSAANTDVSSGSGSFAGLIHNTQYTIRVWNAATDCFTDMTISTPPINCGQPCTTPNCFGVSTVRNN